MSDDEDDAASVGPTEAELGARIIACEEIPLPPLLGDGGRVVIWIVPGELWCRKCGNVGVIPASQASNRSPQKSVDTCIRCGSVLLVPAATVLRSDEYCIRG